MRKLHPRYKEVLTKIAKKKPTVQSLALDDLRDKVKDLNLPIKKDKEEEFTVHVDSLDKLFDLLNSVEKKVPNPVIYPGFNTMYVVVGKGKGIHIKKKK